MKRIEDRYVLRIDSPIVILEQFSYQNENTMQTNNKISSSVREPIPMDITNKRQHVVLLDISALFIISFKYSEFGVILYK